MQKKIILVLLVLFAIFLYATPVYSASDDWKVVIRVDGTVQSQKYQQVAWDNIWQSKMLKDGDKARTLKDSRANIRLADNSVITIGENTTVQMTDFKLTPQSRIAKLNLLAGKLRIKVGKFFGKESKFEVTTPTAVLAARGTDFYVEETSKNEQASLVSLAPAGSLTVMVFEGSVNANVGGQSFTVPAGQMITATPGGILINPLPQVTAPAPTVASTGGGEQQQGQDQGQQQQGQDQGQQQGPGKQGAGTPPPKVDVDLTAAGYGAPSPQAGGGTYYVVGGTPTKPPATGTCGTIGGATRPGGQPIFNPNNQDTGSLPVTVQ